MLADRVSECVNNTSAWMMANRLQLNPTKAEILWCTSTRRQHQILTGPVQIGNTTVLPVSQVQDLGVHLDADVTMKAHVTAAVRVCFSALGQIRSVRCSLQRHALLTLIRALVVSKVDYCNSVLATCTSVRPTAVSPKRLCSADLRSEELHCSTNSTGSEFLRGLNSGYVFWCIDVFTVQRYHTSPSLFS